jgi:glutathione-regulated potassium-efflux system ancillary protein KefC/glutathione-regulated potassium-efflux system protein KefB
MSLLAQAALVLLAAVIAVSLFRRLKLSAILGYLAAGIALGPFCLGIVADIEQTMHVAELGVVLLLFVIGLELRPARLRVMRKQAIRLGVPQIVLSTLLLCGVARAAGVPWNAALAIGFALSLSSTPLVLQLLAERGQLTSQQGRAAFTVLLLQDLAVMPMLVLLPLLGDGGGERSLASLLLAAGRGLAALAALVFGGRYVLRPLLRSAAASGSAEVLTATALLAVAGAALLADAAGLSMALGAFVGGLLLADSEYRHELEADLEPFKGLLLGLFFVTVGASVNLELLRVDAPTVLAIACGLMLLKAGVLLAIGRAAGLSSEVAGSLAFALPQAGEFGFVLFSVAVAGGIMSQTLADTLVLAVAISMALSPLLMLLHTQLAARFASAGARAPYETPNESEARVIIAGFGRFGQIVGRVLRGRGIRFVALDVNTAQVDTVLRTGNRVYYGDGSRLDLLESAGARQAEVLVLAMDDSEASVHTAELVKRHFPQLKILARARNRQHALRLMDLGVHYLIREMYVSSLELTQHTLEALGQNRADAERTVARFRAHDEATLQEQLAFKDDEQKLIQTAKQAAEELERLFAADVVQG